MPYAINLVWSQKNIEDPDIQIVVRVLLAPVLSGVLLFLAFPRYDLSYLIWVGLVPLFIAIYGKSLKAGFFLSYCCGIVFFAGVFSWIFDVPGFKFYHHILLSPYEGLYFWFLWVGL